MLSRMLLLCVMGLVIGCGGASSGHRASMTPEGYPANFSLTLLVDDPADRRLFLVEPDRTLRAAVGDGVHGQLYPPRTAVLTRAQMRELWELAGPLGHRVGGHIRVELSDGSSPVVQRLDQWAGLRRPHNP